MVIDPVFSLLFTMFFVVFWGGAALKKALKPGWFKTVLADYDVFPRPIIPLLVFLVPATELCIALAFIFKPIAGLSASMLLLIVYALVLTFNALRGHVVEDCGCSWGAGGVETEMISPKFFIARNVMLALAGLLVLIPVNTRALRALDWINIGLAVLAFIVISMAMEMILKNRTQMKGVYHA